jgi:hypothetical protein
VCAVIHLESFDSRSVEMSLDAFLFDLAVDLQGSVYNAAILEGKNEHSTTNLRVGFSLELGGVGRI